MIYAKDTRDEKVGRVETYTSIVVGVHDGEHAVRHEGQAVGADEPQGLAVLLQGHLRVDCLRLEPLRELIDLVVVHLQPAADSHLQLDVLDRLLQAFLADF